MNADRTEIVEIDGQRIRLLDGRPESALCHECDIELASEVEEVAGLCDDYQRREEAAERSRG